MEESRRLSSKPNIFKLVRLPQAPWIYKDKITMHRCACGKSFEKKNSLTSHARFCKQYVKNKKKQSIYRNGDMYECECGKTFVKHQSLNAHFSQCLIHRNGKIPIDKFGESRKWNIGLTKETNKSVANTANGVSAAMLGFRWTAEQRAKHSQLMRSKKVGGVRENSNRWRGAYAIIDDSKIWLDSSYEVRFVNVLNKFNIKWIKNKQRFSYLYNDRKFYYIPDFYLYEYDLWVEVKGWEKEKDKFKWNQFPNTLTVIRRIDLERLEKIEIKEKIITCLSAGIGRPVRPRT